MKTKDQPRLHSNNMTESEVNTNSDRSLLVNVIHTFLLQNNIQYWEFKYILKYIVIKQSNVHSIQKRDKNKLPSRRKN